MQAEHLAALLLGLFCTLWALWSTYLGVDFVFAVAIAGAVGYALGILLLQHPHFCFCLQLVIAQFYRLIPSDDEKEEIIAEGQQQKDSSKGAINHSHYSAPPWEQLHIDRRLNQELEELFETLMENYVNSWYTEKISVDSSFLVEIRHLIRHSSAKLIKRINEVDLSALLIDDLFPLMLAHIDRICHISSAIFSDRNEKELYQTPISLIEFEVMERWTGEMHWAMRSPENQRDYLRSVADLLVRNLIDDIRIGGCFVDEEHAKMLLQRKGSTNSSAASKWSCHESRHFLRELLCSTVLIPTIDFCSDSDSLNQLVLNLLSDTPPMRISSPLAEVRSDEAPCDSPTDTPPTEVEFLAKFADPCYGHTPDSLLALKLNDLVENPYLTKLFEMYLRDLNGPTHLLDCFVQSRDIHMNIQALNNQNPAKCDAKEREHALNEIWFEAWQLYSAYVFPSAPNRIPLMSAELEQEFSEVIEASRTNRSDDGRPLKMESLKPLERVVELTYQQVHQQLQYNYVIPFCQSENYMGYLCGAPPDVDELIRGLDETEMRHEHTRIPEGAFSLTQFRNKLFNFITPSKDSVSNASSIFYPSTSSNSLDEFAVAPEDTSSSMDSFERANIAMIDLGRDLSKWSVAIDGVEQRKSDTLSGSVYYAFLLVIERNDLPEECFSSKQFAIEEDEDFDETLPKVWTVGHRYEEFYALEDRMREQYGNTLRIGALPDRKTILQLLRIGRNNRALMESHKSHFERFLQQLMQQPNLRRSDLLYAFLTNEENADGLFELSASSNNDTSSSGMLSLPDLNPIRAMRKVQKERGQHLKPFILNLLANTLAPPMLNVPTPSSQQRIQQQLSSLSVATEPSREGSVKSENYCLGAMPGVGGGADGFRSAPGSCRKQMSAPAKMFARATMDSLDRPTTTSSREGASTSPKPTAAIGWKSNFYDLFLFLTVHLGLIARVPVWLEALFCALRSLIGFIFSITFRKRVEHALAQHLLNTEMAIYLVHSLHELVLFLNVPNSSSLSATPSQISVASSGVYSQRDRRKQQFGKEQAVKKTSNAAAPTLISEQERHLRAELVLHCLEKQVESQFPCSPFLRWLFSRMADIGPSQEEDEQQQRMACSVRLLHLCFQMPALNRQLLFVLMDVVLRKLFVEPTPHTGAPETISPLE